MATAQTHGGPLLSIVLVARRAPENLRMVLELLRAQTIAESIELLLVAETKKVLAPVEETLSTFRRSRVLETGNGSIGPGAAKALGVRSAEAPLVQFVEDHSFPAPDCAEMLVQAHGEGDFAAAGPVVLNANPKTARSWGCYLIFYGGWMTAHGRGEAEHLPGNHSCYRKEVLLSYGPQLDRVLNAESVLHWELRSRGHRLKLEPRARVYHLQTSNLAAACEEYLLASRLFAADRTRTWGSGRKFVYALGSPLLPGIRLPRIWKQARRAGLGRGLLLKAMPSMACILSAGAAGELLGYGFGAGGAGQGLIEFERDGRAEFTRRELETAAAVAAEGEHP